MKFAFNNIIHFFESFNRSCMHFDLKKLCSVAIRNLTAAEKLLWSMSFFIIAFALMSFVCNAIWFHYDTPFVGLGLFPGSGFLLLVIFVWSSANRHRFIFSAQLLLVCFYSVLAFYVIGMIALAVMLTPSPWVLGKQLYVLDQALGFHQVALLMWIDKHRIFEFILAVSYNYWLWQSLLLAVMLVAMRRNKYAYEFILGSIMLAIIFCLIYEIFPSLPPAVAVPSPHFEMSSYVLISRYWAIHHFQNYNVGTSGLISFPSYHVAIAVLAVLVTRDLKILRWFFLLYNSLVVFSTIALGYHYLVDIIVALPLTIICWHYISRKFF